MRNQINTLIGRVLLRERAPPNLPGMRYKFFIFAHYVYIYSNQNNKNHVIMSNNQEREVIVAPPKTKPLTPTTPKRRKTPFTVPTPSIKPNPKA